MADKRITDLPELSELYDDSLLVAEQDKKAYKISVGLLKWLVGYPTVMSSLPAASEAYRGKLCIVSDGENDTLYVCMKNNGYYAWGELVPQVETQSGAVYLVDMNGTMLKTADGTYLSVNA